MMQDIIIPNFKNGSYSAPHPPRLSGFDFKECCQYKATGKTSAS